MSRVEDPQQSAKLTITLPSPMVLAVMYDENGRMYPTAGLAFQRMLTLDDLDRMGVRYEFHTTEGRVIDNVTARRMVAENEELARNGTQPRQLLAHPNGDHA